MTRHYGGYTIESLLDDLWLVTLELANPKTIENREKFNQLTEELSDIRTEIIYRVSP